MQVRVLLAATVFGRKTVSVLQKGWADSSGIGLQEAG